MRNVTATPQTVRPAQTGTRYHGTGVLSRFETNRGAFATSVRGAERVGCPATQQRVCPAHTRTVPTLRLDRQTTDDVRHSFAEHRGASHWLSCEITSMPARTFSNATVAILLLDATSSLPLDSNGPLLPWTLLHVAPPLSFSFPSFFHGPSGGPLDSFIHSLTHAFPALPISKLSQRSSSRSGPSKIACSHADEAPPDDDDCAFEFLSPPPLPPPTHTMDTPRRRSRRSRWAWRRCAGCESGSVSSACTVDEYLTATMGVVRAGVCALVCGRVSVGACA